MKIHHMNCGTLRGRFPRLDSIIYCLLVETNQGLVLIDTGIGRQDYLNPSPLMRLFMYWVGVFGDINESAAHQIEELGFSLSEVRHIVLTHLHLDHAGGLRDFPNAHVHVYRTEYEARLKPRGFMERAYDPTHWSHEPKWIVHDRADKDWYGFKSLRIMKDLTPEIRLIPLPGHTRGHCGVAIATENGWLLQCGDAAAPIHSDSDIHGLDQSKHTGSILPRWLIQYLIGRNVPKLRELLETHPDEIEAISAHDMYSFHKYRKINQTRSSS
jgi:glyoxylase-like metal-dependent hydrolase (beta-lactamase superfamily II)